MPRSHPLLDQRNRARRGATLLELRQAADITALKLDLRALRAELVKARRPARTLQKQTTKATSADNYGAFLDHIGVQFTRLIDKGREYFDSCPSCGNVKLPCIDPLIELERLEYNQGEMDELIFPPALAGGSSF